MWAIWRGPSGPTVQLSLRFRTGFLVETGLSLRLWSLADAVTATIPEIKALRNLGRDRGLFDCYACTDWRVQFPQPQLRTPNTVFFTLRVSRLS